VENWRKILNKKATTPEGKTLMGQLNSLISYFNREAEAETKEINWENWKKEIKTEGLVDKIKKNYEDINQQQYNREEVMQKVFSSESTQFRNMNAELNYHRELWMIYLQDNLRFKVLFKYLPSFDDLNYIEKLDYQETKKIEKERLSETGNWLPYSHED